MNVFVLFVGNASQVNPATSSFQFDVGSLFICNFLPLLVFLSSILIICDSTHCIYIVLKAKR
jgi:hypothetical protein